MGNLMISVRCPSCGKNGKFKIDADKTFDSPRGVTSLQISEKIICDHSLVVYLDNNANVRDCFVADFTIHLPKIKLRQKNYETILPEKSNVDIYLLTINLNAQFLTQVIRSCLFNQKILILNEINVLDSHIINFFNFIFRDLFKIDITLLNKQEYKTQKKNFKEHVIIDLKSIYQDKSKILKPKLLKIENKIVQKFIDEPNPKSSLIIIKNEIRKAFELSNTAYKYVKSLDKGTLLSAEDLSNYLNEKYDNIKIQNSYLNFIVEIIEKQKNIIFADAADFFNSI